MTSSTFTRVRLFTDIEDITLDKWLDAENSGKDDLAREILDAGLLVEHMIAEIPLDQNLADNTELKELTENADRVFGLVVCFGCNRAFQNKNDQTNTCPNCGAKLSRSELTPTNLSDQKNAPLKDPEKHPSPSPSPASPKSTSGKKHPRPSRKELNKSKNEKESTTPSKGKQSKTSSHPKPPAGPGDSEDEESVNDGEEEGWFGGSANPAAHAGKHGVKSH